MRNWCPEPFDQADAATAVASAEEAPSFAPAAEPAARDRRFRGEAGFGEPEALLGHMTRRERAVVFELVEQDVAAAYEQKAAAERAELEATQAQALEEMREAGRAWAEAFAARRDAELRDMAAASARLAVQLAERIVRSRVDRDPAVLARAIETTLRGAAGAEDVEVTVSPEDAAWLEADPELRARLGIVRVVADRRVERGGCLLATGDREWNATLAGQLETLTEVVEQWLATTAADPAEGKGDHEPALD